MRPRAVPIILLTVIVFSLGVLVLAQGTQSNGERIRALREEIIKRETANVPSDLIDLNRSKLLERRAELHTLLLVEIDNLRKYKTGLGTLITPEETQKIDDSIRGYDAEAKALEINAASPVPANPQTNAAGQTTPSPTPTPSLPAAKAIEEAQGKGAILNCPDVLSPKNTKVYSELDKLICRLGVDIPKRRIREQLATNRIVLHSAETFLIVKILLAKKYTPAFLVDAEEARLDKQVGGAPSNAGGTSLLVKGGAPAILGFAVENGALSKSVNGTGITFRGNPVGIVNALANKGFVSAVKADEQDPMLRFLKKTSFAFTFNTDRGSQPGVFTATKQQLSSVSARIEFINKRRPELYIKDWEDFLDKNAQPLTNAIAQFPFVDTHNTDERVFPYGKWLDPALQAWFEKTQQALAEASDSEIEAVVQDRLNKLPISELSAETLTDLDRIAKLMGLYSTGRDTLLKKINRGMLITFEYLNKREVSAPDTSNFTFIAEKGTQNGKADFTFNSSLTMFNNMGALRNFIKLNPTLPPARRLRDFQFAGQVDVPFGSVREFGQFVLFAGGKYERLLENASTDIGTVLPNTKGDIGYLQLGIKVPIKGTGFKIPFSVTFANRSELVKEKTVRGNIGFTFDLDTIFAKFKPF